MLKLAQAASFSNSALALYLAISHIFAPDLLVHDRIRLALAFLVFAASASLFSGMIFIWPSTMTLPSGARLASTLPVRVFLFASAAIAGLFLISWCAGSFGRDAAPFLYH